MIISKTFKRMYNLFAREYPYTYGGKTITKTSRNKAMLYLRQIDPQTFSYKQLGELFQVRKVTAYIICKRDADKYQLSTLLLKK